MTSFKQVADNAITATSTTLTSTGVTSIAVTSGTGALFPVPGVGFYVTLWNGTDVNSDPNQEKVLVTARSTDTFTISATTKTHTSPCNVGLLDVAQNTTDIQAAINAIEGYFASPTDGQTLAYSTSLGTWRPVSPSGAVRLAAATNITATATTASAAAGVGTAVAVTGTSISISSSNGLPVVMSFGGTWQQTVAGTGVQIINLYETTSTPTLVHACYAPLPNSTTTPLCFATLNENFDIGVVSSTRTFQIYVQLWSPAGSSPSSKVLNTTGNPTFLRAATGI